MTNSKNAFIIPSALILCLLLSASYLVSLAFKKVIEEDIRRQAVQHQVYMMEDNIRTNIALAMRRVGTRDELIDMARDLANMKLSVPGLRCSGERCTLALTTEETFDNTVTPPLLTHISYKPYIEGAAALKRVSFPAIKIEIPSDANITESQTLSTGNLLCPINTPLFSGTEITKNASDQFVLNVKCKTLNASAQAFCASTQSSPFIGSSCSQVNMNCNVNGGFWMTGLNLDASPMCQLFPQETRAPSSVISPCEGEDIPIEFSLGSNFEIASSHCITKGGVYDFKP